MRFRHTLLNKNLDTKLNQIQTEFGPRLFSTTGKLKKNRIAIKKEVSNLHSLT